MLKTLAVPNQPRTPLRTLRVPDDLWREAARIARDRGETLSDVMRDSLVRYVEEHSPSASPSQPSQD